MQYTRRVGRRVQVRAVHISEWSATSLTLLYRWIYATPARPLARPSTNLRGLRWLQEAIFFSSTYSINISSFSSNTLRLLFLGSTYPTALVVRVTIPVPCASAYVHPTTHSPSQTPTHSRSNGKKTMELER